MSLIVDEHREYLADRPRIDALSKAILEVVKPGDVVLDLASGTGILGLLSCRAGAARVYSIEVGEMVGLAREISRANGFADRHRFIQGLSLHVDLPEKVDVIVCDQIGRFGPESGLIEHLSDVRERFLKPGGSIIPSQVALCIVPVEAPEMWNRVEFWSHSPAGFDFQPASRLAANTGYPVKYRPENLLSSPQLAGSFDLNTVTPSLSMTLRGDFVVDRDDTLHGIGGWFSAKLSNSVTMSNSPLVAQRINRQNVFFPLAKPVSVTKGDHIEIELHIRSTEIIFSWAAKIWQGSREDSQNRISKGCFRHSTFEGMLLSKESLERSRPQFVPKLSAVGEARRSILELCDGKTPLADIEAEVYRRHPSLFRSYSHAAAFVAEVTTRYSV